MHRALFGLPPAIVAFVRDEWRRLGGAAAAGVFAALAMAIVLGALIHWTAESHSIHHVRSSSENLLRHFRFPATVSSPPHVFLQLLAAAKCCPSPLFPSQVPVVGAAAHRSAARLRHAAWRAASGVGASGRAEQHPLLHFWAGSALLVMREKPGAFAWLFALFSLGAAVALWQAAGLLDSRSLENRQLNDGPPSAAALADGGRSRAGSRAHSRTHSRTSSLGALTGALQDAVSAAAASAVAAGAPLLAGAGAGVGTGTGVGPGSSADLGAGSGAGGSGRGGTAEAGDGGAQSASAAGGVQGAADPSAGFFFRGFGRLFTRSSAEEMSADAAEVFHVLKDELLGVAPAHPPPIADDDWALEGAPAGSVVEESFENSRYMPTMGWGSSYPGHLLPTDRRHWSSADGVHSSDTLHTLYPLPDGWEWHGPWKKELRWAQSGATDAEVRFAGPSPHPLPQAKETSFFSSHLLAYVFACAFGTCCDQPCHEAAIGNVFA